MSTTTIGSIESVDLGILDISKAEFYKTDGGFAGLKYDGKDYPHVTLKRALPIAQPNEYISVYDAENKEVGIIKALNELSAANLDIAVNELARRYFCPFVLEIKSVKDKMGYVYIELLLSPEDGSAKTHVKSCALKDVSRNIRMLNEKSIIIFDVDGNRYLIKDVNALDKASRKRIDPYLF